MLTWLITSSEQAHSRGFAWFFAHSRPQGTCSGQHIVATFYASGRRTASGQSFDPSGHTAAHRTLPFGTQVTVFNRRNGRSAVVRINDRGPFVRGRVIDLSPAAARALGIDGLASVSLTVGEIGGGELSQNGKLPPPVETQSDTNLSESRRCVASCWPGADNRISANAAMLAASLRPREMEFR